MHPTVDASDLDTVAEWLQETYGLRPDSLALARLQGAVSERMRVLEVRESSAYVRLVLDGGEIGFLMDRIAVGETAFFRTPSHFEALAKHVLPELDRALPARAELRLWSAACASGEEAYSLAMVCADAFGPSRPFGVLSTDASEAALAKARAGRYGQRSVAKIPTPMLDRYLRVEHGGHRVVPGLAEYVKFKRVNLLDPTLRSQIGSPIHVVLCENVLIYFGGTRSTERWQA